MSEQVTVTGKKFFVILAGKTNGADKGIINTLQRSRQTEVESPEDCDYQVLICPVVSRVETDVDEALSKARNGKPTILMVLHHTFDRDCFITESSRLVHDPNIILTVDFLFYEDKLLNCNRSDISWYEIEKALGVRVSRTPQRCFSSWTKKVIVASFGFVILVTLIVVIGELYIKFKKT